MTVEVPFVPLPVDQSDVRYAHGPDSARRPGVPTGQTIEFDWNDSAVYPGTSRKFWVHLPARYDPSQPAALMAFQDGRRCLDPDGEVRGAIVLDNLVHRGGIPVTVGLFVAPGVLEVPPSHRTATSSTTRSTTAVLLPPQIPHPCGSSVIE